MSRHLIYFGDGYIDAQLEPYVLSSSILLCDREDLIERHLRLRNAIITLTKGTSLHTQLSMSSRKIYQVSLCGPASFGMNHARVKSLCVLSLWIPISTYVTSVSPQSPLD